MRLCFISYLCESVFDRFLVFFQSEEPLIHLLYSELTKLYRNILLSFMEPDSIQQKTGQELLDIDFDQAALWNSNKEMRIGESLRE